MDLDGDEQDNRRKNPGRRAKIPINYRTKRPYNKKKKLPLPFKKNYVEIFEAPEVEPLEESLRDDEDVIPETPPSEIEAYPEIENRLESNNNNDDDFGVDLSEEMQAPDTGEEHISDWQVHSQYLLDIKTRMFLGAPTILSEEPSFAKFTVLFEPVLGRTLLDVGHALCAMWEGYFFHSISDLIPNNLTSQIIVTLGFGEDEENLSYRSMSPIKLDPNVENVYQGLPEEEQLEYFVEWIQRLFENYTQIMDETAWDEKIVNSGDSAGDIFQMEVTILYSDEIENETNVGCRQSKKDENIKKGRMFLWNPSSKKLDCAIQVLHRGCTDLGINNLSFSEFTKKIREHMFTEHQILILGTLTLENHFFILANYLEICITTTSNPEVLEETIYGDQEKPKVRTFYKDNHMMLIYKHEFIEDYCKKCHRIKKIDVEHICPTTCPYCRVKYIKRHKCDQSKIEYLQNKSMRKLPRDRLIPKNIFGRKANYLNLIVFDCEAFHDENGLHNCYAVGWMWWEKSEEDKNVLVEKYDSRFGKGCMNSFISWLKRRSTLLGSWKMIKKGKEKQKVFCPKVFTLCGFNSARYDNTLFARAVMDSTKENPKFTVQSGSILCLETSFCKMWDLIKFTPGQSLESLCKTFECPTDISKDHFPHKFAKKWEDLNYVGKTPGREYYFKYPKEGVVERNDWNFKKVCFEYLKKDVMSTAFCMKKLEEEVFESLKVNIFDFITAPHMSYELWVNFVAKPFDDNPRENPFISKCLNLDMPFVTIEEENRSRQCIYGGRCFGTIRDFKSKEYDEVMQRVTIDGEKKIVKGMFEKIEDFVIGYDVVGLYASCMEQNYYPTGSITTEEKDMFMWNLQKELLEEGKYDDMLLGIWKVKYSCNKKLIIPGLPFKEFKMKNGIYGAKSGLVWDLIDREGYYTTIDIIEAHKLGYKFEILEMHNWSSKAKLFEKFIELGGKMKMEGTRDNNPIKTSLGKLINNSTYGKMLQRIMLEICSIIKSNKSLSFFLNRNELKECIFINDERNSLVLKGVIKDKEKKITKLSYIGAFVLSYSRKTMNFYQKVIDPARGDPNRIAESIENSILYTDTDSIHVRGNRQALDRMKPFIDKLKGGMMDYDLKDESKIIRAIYLAPKTYLFMYVTPKDELKMKIKCKGVDSKNVTLETFEEILNGKAQNPFIFNGIKRVNLTNKVKGINPFNLINQEQKRTMCKSLWEGRDFQLYVEGDIKSNQSMSMPFGFDGEDQRDIILDENNNNNNRNRGKEEVEEILDENAQNPDELIENTGTKRLIQEDEWYDDVDDDNVFEQEVDMEAERKQMMLDLLNAIPKRKKYQ